MKFVKISGIIFLVTILILGLFYTIMVFSTNEIYKCIQQVIKKEIIIEDKSNPLNYFVNESGPNAAAYSTFDFSRKKTWHNFNAGQFTLVYSENIFDENNNLIHQFKNIEVIIYIEKYDGKWIVTNIKRII